MKQETFASDNVAAVTVSATGLLNLITKTSHASVIWGGQVLNVSHIIIAIIYHVQTMENALQEIVTLSVFAILGFRVNYVIRPNFAKLRLVLHLMSAKKPSLVILVNVHTG